MVIRETGTMKADELLASANQDALLTVADLGNNVSSDSFIINVKRYLKEHGNEIKLPGGSICWSIPLRNGIQLYVYEQPLNESTSVCDQCRIIGTEIKLCGVWMWEHTAHCRLEYVLLKSGSLIFLCIV